LTYGLEVLGHAVTPWAVMTAFIGAGLFLGTLALRHLRRAKQSLIPLVARRIPTYAMTLRGGSLFRVSVTMVPFLPPTMFQLGFGLNPFASGLLIIPLFAGSLGTKIMTTRMLRRYGFRRVLLVNGAMTTLAILGCAALTPSTSYAVIVVVLFANGLDGLPSVQRPELAGVRRRPVRAYEHHEYPGERSPAVDIGAWHHRRSRGCASRRAAAS